MLYSRWKQVFQRYKQVSCLFFVSAESLNIGIVKICAVKKYPKFDFATYRTSIAVTTINSFLEFCQGRRRRLF